MAQFPGPPSPPVFPDSVKNKPVYRAGHLSNQANFWPDMQVFVVGPGAHKHALDIARQVWPSGKVFVIGNKQAGVEQLELQANARGLDNLITQVAFPDSLPLSDDSVDRAFLIRMLNRTAGRQKVLAEVRRVLKPDGLLVVDQRLLDPGFPRRKAVVRWCTEAGFELVARRGYPLHYLLEFGND